MVGLTPAERRLAALLLGLALLGSVSRGARSLSPEVAAWIDGPEAVPPPRRDPLRPRQPPPEVGPIDPNLAGIEELCSLRGIGPALAARIVEARAQGPYRAPNDLLRVRGIGPAVVAGITHRLHFGEAVSPSQTENAKADSLEMGRMTP